MKKLMLSAGILMLAAAVAGAQSSRADSLRQKQIADSIALMRAIESAQAPTAASSGTPVGGAQGPTNPRMLPDISAVGDMVADLSPQGSTQEDNARFSLREVELALQAVVDPYFRGDIFLGISDLEGVAIEQAYLTTTGLPDIEVRLGRYLMPFGKQNTTHRHDLHTIEYPWVIQRFLGAEGLKGTGLAASKVFAPFGFYQELQVTAVDRLREPPEGLVASEAANKSLGGLGYAARLRNYVDLDEATNVELSASALTGKIERGFTDIEGNPVATGDGVNATLARQTMLGADLTFRWRPLQQGLYKSFILQAEFMRQLNQARPASNVDGIPPSAVPLGRDLDGAYAFARYQLTRRLFLGARYDYAQDPLADGRTLNAGSGYLEWFPSEFSKLSGGYERLNEPGRGGLNRILLQASFALGPHKPHPF